MAEVVPVTARTQEFFARKGQTTAGHGGREIREGPVEAFRVDAGQHPRGTHGHRLPRTSAQKASDEQHQRATQPIDQGEDTAYQRIPESSLAAQARLGDLHGDQRRIGDGNDLSHRKGALKGSMNRCEFTDKTLALSNYLVCFCTKSSMNSYFLITSINLTIQS